MPLRVLLTGDDHYAPLAAARALRAAGHEPWAAVDMDDCYLTRSRTLGGVLRVPTPGAEPDAFAEAVRVGAERLGAAAVLPGDESALVALAGARDHFAAAVGAPEPALVEAATDKARIGELAAAAGLETPPTERLDREKLEARAGALDYPMMLEPVRSKLAAVYAKPARVDGPAQLAAALAEVPGETWLVQPYLGNRIRAVAGVAWEGELICALHQVTHRLFPRDVGLGAYSETVPAQPALQRAAAAVAERLGWSGPFQLQFVEHRGIPYLIDLNPRIYGSLALALRAGLNLPSIWVQLLLGRRPSPGGYAAGVRYRAEELDGRALLAALRERRLVDATRILRPRRRTAHAVFSWRDPAPFGLTLAKLAHRL